VSRPTHGTPQFCGTVSLRARAPSTHSAWPNQVRVLDCNGREGCGSSGWKPLPRRSIEDRGLAPARPRRGHRSRGSSTPSHRSPATRARVDSAIRALRLLTTAELGFAPEPLAPAPPRSAARSSPRSSRPSAVDRIRGVVAALDGSNYTSALFDVESPDDRTPSCFDVPRERDDRVDGFSSCRSSRRTRDRADLRRPDPLLPRRGAHPTLRNCVVVDDVFGGSSLRSHLIELGHRRIAMLGDSTYPFRFHSSRDRTTGYEQALLRREGSSGVGLTSGSASRAVGSRAQLPRELRSFAAPPAISSPIDLHAIGVLEAARILRSTARRRLRHRASRRRGRRLRAADCRGSSRSR